MTKKQHVNKLAASSLRAWCEGRRYDRKAKQFPITITKNGNTRPFGAPKGKRMGSLGYAIAEAYHLNRI